MHVLIIGAGIVGAAIAHNLAAHARVTILEATAPAAAASGKSFGWINASFFANPAHHRLRVHAIAAHRRLDAEMRTGTQWTGTLWWEETGAAFDAVRDMLMSLDYPTREIDADAFARAEPNIATPPDRSLQFPSEGAVDAAALTDRLLASALHNGARLWLGTPLRAITRTDRVTGIQTDQGPIAADHVVLATGTATEGLLAPLGIPLPMLCRPGVLLRTEALPPLINHVLAGPGAEMRQSADGHLLTPAEAAHQSDATEVLEGQPGTLADAALARIAGLLPVHPMRWSRVMLGHRPVPADGLPAVGQVLPGLTVATMHSGVTLAALIGELVAAEVLGQGTSPLLTPYHPARFA